MFSKYDGEPCLRLSRAFAPIWHKTLIFNAYNDLAGPQRLFQVRVANRTPLPGKLPSHFLVQTRSTIAGATSLVFKGALGAGAHRGFLECPLRVAKGIITSS